MTEAISSVASLENLTKFQDQPQTRDLDRDAFLEAFDQGLGTLSQRPEFTDELTPMDEISGTFAGEVGAEKSGIMSDSAKSGERSNEEVSENLEQRFTSLYFEMTHYQVAWKIAQNVQRDVSQVLRGS